MFTSKAGRANLHYKVFEKGGEDEKYQQVRDLIEEKNCPTIIYVSRTRKAYILAERLTEDGFIAKPYHGKMDAKEKTANQNAFIAGEVPIMVATSAFGMGVDKKDVGMVIHYEIFLIGYQYSISITLWQGILIILNGNTKLLLWE